MSIKQKQIKNLVLADLAALTANGNTSEEVVFITAENKFYTRIAGVNTVVNPPVASNLAVGTVTSTVVPITNSNGTGFTIPAATSTLAGAMPSADKVKTDFITVTSAINLNTLSTTVAGKEDVANKGIANGYASLDATGKVPAAQLPAYVDDVLEYTNLAAFPVTGSTGIMYVALDTNLVYRWSGSAYVEISAFSGTATNVAFSATGNLASTNVQTALVELDDEKQGDIQLQNATVNVGTAGQALTYNFTGGISSSISGSVATITVATGATDNFYQATVSATNTITTLSPAPISGAKVRFYVNGILETAGVSITNGGVVTITPATLGYSIETTDIVTVGYLS
jgi:hypothetical protein